jgi:hypothetical protein
MSQANSKTTCSGTRPPFTPEIIDLTDHPDALLLEMCALLARTRDAVTRLEETIVATPSRTADGARAKGLAL